MGYCRMSAKTKLELTWIGKENRPRLEPRILIEDERLSHHADARREGDQFENILIRGDNLLALRALEATHTGCIKCAYIDPPFNTGQAFTHYNDGIEHSLWLSLIRDRLEIIHRLLSDDGSIWLHLDDVEVHRARCILDEVFGSKNFVATVIWEKADSPRMDARLFSVRHDYIIVYARDIDAFNVNKVGSEAEVQDHYNKRDVDGRLYYLKPLRAMGADGTREARPTLYFPLFAPDGTKVYPKNPDGSDSRWRWGPQRVEQDAARIEWVEGRTGWSAYFRVYADQNTTRPPETIWTHSETGSNRTSKAEAKALAVSVKPFDTPKPEKLLKRVLEIATSPGDIVLDSFGGSGTTGAVAHKMGRKWIMVELGDHCETHIVPRMKKVIDGNDPGGITKAVDWKGGGGYRYFRLAPSLLEKDQFGQWVISKAYNAEMLAEAMCKHFGFTYAPSVEHYWMHGYSSETDFIYVTTNSLTHDQLRAISDEVGDGRTLLTCCKAFQGTNAESFANLTIRKIPGAVLDRCEWGKDDYSLKIEALPLIEDAPETDDEPGTGGKPRGRPRKADDAPSLFDAESEA
jgi:adenine-specific DNA-methyltransferase